MKTTWTEWARTRVLPFPGEPWTVDVDLAAVVKRLDKAGAVTPMKPVYESEVALARALRVHERYDLKGNYPKDTHGRDLVDVWVARAGVEFALRCAIGACSGKRADGKSYELRLDAQPWPRLREHLFAASESDRASARTHATKARSAKSELRQAMAFLFADPAWVSADLEGMFEHGYGQLALLAAIPDAKTGRLALKRLIEEGPDPDEYIAKYQLVENAYPFVPTLMTRLDDSDADLVVRCCERAWNNATRKPWLEIAGSLDTPAARAFVAKHGAKKAAAKKPATKTTSAAPAKKPTKKSTKKSTTKKPTKR